MDDWINAIPQFAESPPYIDLVNAKQKPAVGDNSIWMCPDAVSLDDLRADELSPTAINQIDVTTFFAYGMNMALSTPYMGRPDRIDRIGPLKTMVFMADALGPVLTRNTTKKAYTPNCGHWGARLTSRGWPSWSYLGDELGCRSVIRSASTVLRRQHVARAAEYSLATCVFVLSLTPALPGPLRLTLRRFTTIRFFPGP